MKTITPAAPLRCTTCSSVAGNLQGECIEQMCASTEDRCFGMTYNMSIGAIKVKGWEKGCKSPSFCALSDAEACAETKTVFGLSVAVSDCKKICSDYNDIILPHEQPSTTSPPTDTTTTTMPTTMATTTTAAPLRCTTCSSVAGNLQGECIEQMCASPKDRCFGMTYNISLGFATVEGWEKGCKSPSFCALSNVEACAETKTVFGLSVTISDCKKMCSDSNDIVLPHEQPKTTSPPTDTTTTNMPTTMSTTTPATPLSCTTCSSIAGNIQGECIEQMCASPEHRCYGMTYNMTLGVVKVEAWEKGCKDPLFCSMSDIEACEATQKIFGVSVAVTDCKKVCSNLNDIILPGEPIVTTTTTPTAMPTTIPGPFQCATCEGVEGQSMQQCVNEICPSGMDRCLAVTYRKTNINNGQTINMWKKECNNEFFCSLSDQDVCRFMAPFMGSSFSINECKKACSFSNDVQMPEFPPQISTTMRPQTTPTECIRCHENARCGYEDGSVACFCNEGFVGDGYNCKDCSLCDENASCADTDGASHCHCDDGFTGDGFNCRSTGLVCATCQGVEGQPMECVNEVCDAGMDRCLAMTYKMTSSSGQTMNMWMKQCNNRFFCSLSDQVVCTITQQFLGGSFSLSECKKACSSSNDVEMPEFPPSSALQCDTCSGYGDHQNGPCTRQMCAPGMNRCMGTSINMEVNGHEVRVWNKSCSSETMCSRNEMEACRSMINSSMEIDAAMRYGVISNCIRKCSLSNDIELNITKFPKVPTISPATVCEDLSYNIVCPSDEMISVTSVMWGRDDNTTCRRPEKNNTRTNCRSTAAETRVMRMCNGRSNCMVGANMWNFGDPCEDTSKFLRIEYKCAPLKSVYMCPYSTHVIKCPFEQQIKIHEPVFWGNRAGQTCEGRSSKDAFTLCSDSGIETKLSDMCDGKRSCNLRANPFQLGNAGCPQLRKFLQFSYECEEQS